MRIRHAIGALVMAFAASSGPALADSRGQATVGNLRFTLFDLDLTDSVTPSLVWSIPGFPSGLMSPGSLTVGYTLNDAQVRDHYLDSHISLPGSPARLSFSQGSHVSVEAALAHPDPLGQLLSVSTQIAPSGQRVVSTTGELYSDRLGFTLSPNTRVTFMADLSFTGGTQALADFDEQVDALGEIAVDGHAPFGDRITETALLQAGTLRGDPLALDQTISLSVDFNNAASSAAYGDVTLRLMSQAQYWPVSAVPEPSAYAMLLAGLALFGWRRKGRDDAADDRARTR